MTKQPTTAVASYSAAQQALSLAVRIDDVLPIINQAAALAEYARRAKDLRLIADATTLRLYAEKRAGELLEKMNKSGEREARGGDRKSKSKDETLIAKTSLRDMGVTKTQSIKWQALTQLPPENFQTKVDAIKRRAANSSTSAPEDIRSQFTGEVERYTPVEYIELAPISCSWEMTPNEIRLASDTEHFLDRLGLPLFYGVVSNRHACERETRKCVRMFKNEIAKEQARQRLPLCPAYLEILEGKPSVHSNILFPLADQKRATRWIASLQCSARFPDDTLKIQVAKGVGWFVSYCAKERTPQARYVGGVGALASRRSGSHKLGDGGGDRVRLSKPIEAALIAAGTTPRRRTYASRALPSALPARERGSARYLIAGTGCQTTES